MKLQECTNNQSTYTTENDQYVVNVIETSSVLQEGTRVDFSIDSKSGLVKGEKSLATLPNDSVTIGTIAGLASDVVRRKFSKRKHTFHFFARTIDDKRLYKKVVEDLLSTGKYRLVRRMMTGSGILWELQRTSL